jgi:hypothetical protein
MYEGGILRLDIAQNLNAIAYATLEDRMHRELATSLLRLALKQASEYAVGTINQNVAALLSVANAVTERADTRNWQTLPYAIHYARLALPPGDKEVTLRQFSTRSSRSEDISLNLEVSAGETRFYTIHQIASYPLSP